MSAGRGVPLDFAEAVKWYRKAANQGYAEAQYNLGILYATGGGVAQDYVQAHTWLNLAASRFPADHYRDDAVTMRDLVVAPNMTTAQIAEAQKLAREWRPTAPNP
jgi:TPR repeat protein